MTGSITLAFWVLFDQSKHLPALAQVGSFIEDPFDAVGSFGVQLAGLAVIVAAVRLFASRLEADRRAETLALSLQAALTALAAIAVTLAADGIALLRSGTRWAGAPAGWLLAALVSVLLALDLSAGGWALRLGRSRYGWRRPAVHWIALLGCGLSGLALAAYPQAWRANVAGGVGAALLGMLVLFAGTAAVLRVILPDAQPPARDLLDDLGLVLRWASARYRLAANLLRWIETLADRPGWRVLVGWLDPRRTRWIALLLVGLGLGLLLLLREMLSEGAPERPAMLLVLSVYLAIECSGVLLGYLLLNRYLGILKKAPA